MDAAHKNGNAKEKMIGAWFAIPATGIGLQYAKAATRLSRKISNSMFRWKGVLIALLLILLAGSLVPLFVRGRVTDKSVLAELSDDEKHCLSLFLRITLFYENFAYLLFGNKPLAFTSCQKSVSSFLWDSDFLDPIFLEERKGLEVFKKMQPLFLSRNIIVDITEDDHDIYMKMINKKNLLRVLRENIEDFKQVLGAETTVEQLFNRITGRKEYIYDIVKGHQALYGILLGFGKNNSWLFHKKDTIYKKLNAFTPPQIRDDSLQKEFDEIQKNTAGFNDVFDERKYILKNPQPILLPGFMIDPNSVETKQLREMYGKDRQRMKNIFSEQNFVEATLTVLMNN